MKNGVETIIVYERHVMTIGIIEFLRIIGLFGLSILDNIDGTYVLIGPSDNLESFATYWSQKTLVM